MLLSNCAICGKKNSTFINNQELIKDQFKKNYNILLTRDKFMPELHLKHQSACGIFAKHRERIQNFRKTGHLNHLHRNELALRTISEKIFKGQIS